MLLLKRIGEFLLYSNIFIALCALAFSLQTTFFLNQNFKYQPIYPFIFFGTWLTYALHRLISLKKIKVKLHTDRFLIIKKYKRHIIIYSIIAGLGSLYFFFQLKIELQLYLLLPSFISIAYVLPIFGQDKNRLRDFNFIKIYLIAIIWAFTGVVLPVLGQEVELNNQLLLLSFSKACFIFAITIPFDIRDLSIDKELAVKTVPSTLGISKSLYLAYALMLIVICLDSYLYPPTIAIALGIFSFLTIALIKYTSTVRADYFYTGILDGTILLQSAIIWIGYQCI